jgi:hypothetical protein
MTTKPLTKLLEEQGPFDVEGDVDAAMQRWVDYRVENGYKATATPLLGDPDSNLKLHKTGYSDSKLSVVYGLSLMPADASGIDACLWRSPECTSACVLVTAGNSTFPSVRRARTIKTLFLRDHPQDFVLILAEELRRAASKHHGIAVRLNVASDLRWERIAPKLFELQGITFYDYTKAPRSQRDQLDGRYHLTFSVSEKSRSETEAEAWLAEGGNAAVVFAVKPGQALPETWHGYPVIDGDVTDARHEDLPSSVVGLRAKGSARTQLKVGGFVKEGVST